MYLFGRIARVCSVFRTVKLDLKWHSTTLPPNKYECTDSEDHGLGIHDNTVSPTRNPCQEQLRLLLPEAAKVEIGSRTCQSGNPPHFSCWWWWEVKAAQDDIFISPSTVSRIKSAIDKINPHQRHR